MLFNLREKQEVAAMIDDIKTKKMLSRISPLQSTQVGSSVRTSGFKPSAMRIAI